MEYDNLGRTEGKAMLLKWSNLSLLQSDEPYLQFHFLLICCLYMTQQLILLAPHVCYTSLQFLYTVIQTQ